MKIGCCVVSFCVCRESYRPPYAIVDYGQQLSGQAAQPVPSASLKLSMAVYGQQLDGDLPDERPKELTLPSFGRDVKLGVLCLDAACIVGLT